MGIVKGIVNPICDDVMAVDWVANVVGPVVIRPGAVMRFNILKLKEGVGENEKEQVLKVIGEVKEHFGSIEQISYGENFQIARGKGFSIASLAVFPGLEELEEVDKNEEVVKEHKEKVRELLDGVIVLDYVVHTPQSANL
ncbi:hypothetical protein IFM89_021601 [Coptis chinensis]|uniref:Stress-response A/B barrel domain-containing protein n=1 Tax=Coptis chinensis TaxID=261450 RepID=A0A835IBL8_9MAGN|nr:hypothetical protein IFM89_021601 [Coptis chinensis]